jgi:hypothetical protein
MMPALLMSALRAPPTDSRWPQNRQYVNFARGGQMNVLGASGRVAAVAEGAVMKRGRYRDRPLRDSSAPAPG